MSIDHEALFEGYCRDTLDAADRERLLALLSDDEPLRRRFADHLLFHCANIEATTLLRGVQKENHSPATAPAQPQPRLLPRPERRRRRRPARRATMAWRIAAGFLLLTGASILIAQFGQPAGPIAIPHGSVHLARDNGERLLPGDHTLRPGDRLLVGDDGGRVRVRFADGTHLELTAGTLELREWRQRKRVHLLHGELSAVVTPQTADPMIITSPQSQTTVLGTAFTLRAEASWSDVTVSEGQVRFARNADEDGLIVAEGQTARAAPGVAWGAFPQDAVPPASLQADDAILEPGSLWRRISDPRAEGGRALQSESAHHGNLALADSDGSQAARFRFFAEPGMDYVIWVRGCSMPSPQPAQISDMVMIIIPGAEWLYNDWRQHSGWDWMPQTEGPAPPLYNSFALRHQQGTYGWIAGPADPRQTPQVPERLRLRFPTAGIYELRLFPIEGPMRIDRIVLRPADDQAPPE